VCQVQIPACNDDDVQKLRDLHPERSLDLNLPSPETLAALCDGEEGQEQMV
jgi:hypothetical protein